MGTGGTGVSVAPVPHDEYKSHTRQLVRMEDELFNYIDSMLESVQEAVDDDDLAFKLRTARQSLVGLEEQYREGQAALEQLDVDDETLDSLRELGYLD